MTTYDEVMRDIRAGKARGNGVRNIKGPSEHQFQRTVADYLDSALPADAFWTSIDSAGRGAVQGAQMKARGVRKGIFDTLVLWRNITLWIELKSDKGKLTPEQRRFAGAVDAAGHYWAVATRVEHVAETLGKLGIPLRCSLSA